MKIQEIILNRGAKIAREVRRLAKQSKQTVPLAAERGGVIGDTVQIGKNVHSVSNMSFKSKGITNAERKEIVERLSTKMQDRSEKIQKLYQLNIDFVNKKINKQKYLDELEWLIMYPNGQSVRSELDKGERIFVGGYSRFFDLYGADVDGKTKKNIISDISILLHTFD